MIHVASFEADARLCPAPHHDELGVLERKPIDSLAVLNERAVVEHVDRAFHAGLSQARFDGAFLQVVSRRIKNGDAGARRQRSSGHLDHPAREREPRQTIEDVVQAVEPQKVREKGEHNARREPPDAADAPEDPDQIGLERYNRRHPCAENQGIESRGRRTKRPR